MALERYGRLLKCYFFQESHGSNYGGGVTSVAEVAGPAALLLDYHLSTASNAIANALALVYFVLLFYLTLTLLLGTLFDSRGPVIGIPLGLVFGYQLVLGMAPWLATVMPWNLTIAVGPDKPSLAATLAQGRPLPTLGTLTLSVLFIAVAIWRFNQEEF
jgi:cbb3-type cytochrome oxidase subunit 3